MEIPEEDLKKLYNLTVNFAEQVCGEFWPCIGWFEDLLPILDKYEHLIDDDRVEELGYLRRFYSQECETLRIENEKQEAKRIRKLERMEKRNADSHRNC
jgi:hypothetical protein